MSMFYSVLLLCLFCFQCLFNDGFYWNTLGTEIKLQ